MPDLVIFRRWNDTGDVVAVFPEQPADDQGRFCIAPDELGQHIAAEYEQVMPDTTPVTAQEYGRFAHELTMLGYDMTCNRSAQHRNSTTSDDGRRQGSHKDRSCWWSGHLLPACWKFITTHAGAGP